MTKITCTKGKLEEAGADYVKVIFTDDKADFQRLIEKEDGALELKIGLGKIDKVTLRSFRTLVRTVVQLAKTNKLHKITVDFSPVFSGAVAEKGAEWFYRTIAENLSLAQYEFLKYKTTAKKNKRLEEVLVCGVDEPVKKRSFLTGLTVATSANITRDVANTCGSDMTPSELAKVTKEQFKGTDVKVTILDKKAVTAQKLGLLEAVGKGASDGPCLIVIEYWGAGKITKKDKKNAPIALIGKGVTYDSGGLNVKPSGYMHDMHLDMSGGAAIIGALHAIATLKLKKNVIGIIPAAENAISEDSMRAGDIVTSLSGKTVEVLHTDAEGRLILADALTYASEKYQPRVILDVATLTGASLVALGQFSSAVLTKNENLAKELTELGEETGDLMWPLPLWDEYKQSLKSTRADIANIATNFSRFAGCIEGGTFLSFFAPKNTPWAHIDIAPRMDSIASDKLAKGATGEPVRLLVKFVEDYQ